MGLFAWLFKKDVTQVFVTATSPQGIQCVDAHPAKHEIRVREFIAQVNALGTLLDSGHILNERLPSPGVRGFAEKARRRLIRTSDRQREAALVAVIFFATVTFVSNYFNADSEPEDIPPTTVSTSARAYFTAPPVEPPRPYEAPTDQEVVDLFWERIHERASSGVRLASLATDVSLVDRVVTVLIIPDPVVLELSPFDNLSKFFGTVLAFDNPTGVWLRRSVDRVDVISTDGDVFGSLTSDELNRMATIG
jgi:hypothetical protein